MSTTCDDTLFCRHFVAWQPPLSSRGRRVCTGTQIQFHMAILARRTENRPVRLGFTTWTLWHRHSVTSLQECPASTSVLCRGVRACIARSLAGLQPQVFCHGAGAHQLSIEGLRVYAHSCVLAVLRSCDIRVLRLVCSTSWSPSHTFVSLEPPQFVKVLRPGAGRWPAPRRCRRTSNTTPTLVPTSTIRRPHTESPQTTRTPTVTLALALTLTLTLKMQSMRHWRTRQSTHRQRRSHDRHDLAHRGTRRLERGLHGQRLL